MGPTTLFDKSFLQALSLDESVWFDHFFIPNVCPVFFAETLADLEKEPRDGRTSEEEVRVIADKTPQVHGAPCVHHLTMCESNLFGEPVTIDTGQIPLAGGRRVRVGGEVGMVFEQTPEARAFARWQKQEFHELERDFARQWRTELATLDLKEAAMLIKGCGLEYRACRTLDDARAAAADLIGGTDRLADRMRLALSFLGVRRGLFAPIQEVWNRAGRPPLPRFAPYAAYAAEVEIFFNIALAANLISTERRSNRLDIAYLHYLPFCMVFVSTDNLHRRCAPLFMRQDQDFAWGQDLKGDLRRIDEHFKSLPEGTKEMGIMAFAHTPPEFEGSLLIKLWDKHLPRWRELLKRDEPVPSKKNPELVRKLRRFERAPALPPGDPAYDSADSDALTMQRMVTKKRGAWWQLPKDLDAKEIA